MGKIGRDAERVYSSQAAERRVYDAPKEKLLGEDVPGLEAEDDQRSKLDSQLDENAVASRNEDILEAGAERGIDDRSVEVTGSPRPTANTVLGQDQRQADVLETSQLASRPDSGAAGDSDIAILSASKSNVLREGRSTEKVDEIHTDSEVATSSSNGESDIQDDWQEFEEDQDAEDRQNFQANESEAVETLEDLDLLRALKKRALSDGVGYDGLRAYFDSQAQPDSEQEPINRTIHILGLGAAGKYIAHSLAGLPFAPPITLLMHRPLMMQHWHDEGAAIHLIKNGAIKTQTNFHIESSADFVRQDSQQRFPGFGPRREHTAEPPNYPIDALIVTTEAYRTVSALAAIKHRLGRGSTIFLLNNGLGLAERINERVFTDPYDRPTYILGNMSHTLESTERHFTLIEKNAGRLECSKFPRVSTSRRGRHTPVLTRKDFSWTPHASHLVGTLVRTPEFSTVALGHKSFYESQFQNLAAGAVIGPLSVVFDCTNDLILYNYNASQIMKLLLHEISRVIRSLPELQSLPDLDKTFGVKRLEAIVVSKISKTGKNISTMLQNVRAGNRTNLDYYNGYIDRRAKELNIDTPRNQMMLHLVRGKTAAKSREMNNYIPFEDDY